LVHSTSPQNLATLASAISEIDCGHRNWKWVIGPWPRPLLGVVCHTLARILSSLPVYKIWRLCFSRSRDIIRTSKYKMGHVTLARHLLSMRSLSLYYTAMSPEIHCKPSSSVLKLLKVKFNCFLGSWVLTKIKSRPSPLVLTIIDCASTAIVG